MESKQVVDGVIFVTQDELENYIYSPIRKDLMKRAGMTDEEIDRRCQAMLHGRIPVTYHKAIVQVKQ